MAPTIQALHYLRTVVSGVKPRVQGSRISRHRVYKHFAEYTWENITDRQLALALSVGFTASVKVPQLPSLEIGEYDSGTAVSLVRNGTSVSSLKYGRLADDTIVELVSAGRQPCS